MTVLGWSYFYAATSASDPEFVKEMYAQAIPIFETLIGLEPNEKDHYAKLGLCLSRTGRKGVPFFAAQLNT